MLYVDARTAFQEQLDGKAHYTLAVLRQIAQSEPQLSLGLLLNNSQKKLVSQADWLGPRWEINYISGKSLLWQRNAAKFIRQQENAKLFSPTSYVLPYLANIPSLVTVHDLISFRHPQGHKWYPKAIEKVFLPRLIKSKAVQFLAVSHTTKTNLLQEFTKLDGSRVHTAQLGLTTQVQKQTEPLPPEPYFLTVAGLLPRKNIKVLLDAFNHLWQKQPKLQHYTLKIIGNGPEADTLKQYAQTLAARPNIEFPGYVSGPKLQKLYQTATATIIPSQYEGFGLQLLEAMALNSPLVCSNIPVFQEVAGLAALYANAQDPHAFSAKMTELATQPELRNELIKKGQDQLQKFSWQTTVNTIKTWLREQ